MLHVPHPRFEHLLLPFNLVCMHLDSVILVCWTFLALFAWTGFQQVTLSRIYRSRSRTKVAAILRMHVNDQFSLCVFQDMLISSLLT
jgi:hypothetical protein